MATYVATPMLLLPPPLLLPLSSQRTCRLRHLHISKGDVCQKLAARPILNFATLFLASSSSSQYDRKQS